MVCLVMHFDRKIHKIKNILCIRVKNLRMKFDFVGMMGMQNRLDRISQTKASSEENNQTNGQMCNEAKSERASKYVEQVKRRHLSRFSCST